MTAQVFEIIDEQILLGQQILNVYHYYDSAGTRSITDVVAAYEGVVVPDVAAFQTDELTHVGTKYRTVYPTVSLMLEHAYTPVAGSITSTEMGKSEDALSFKFILGSGTVVLQGGFTGHIKRGGCRIGGISNLAVVNDVIQPSYITPCAAWATALMDPDTGHVALCVASFLNGARARQHAVQSVALVTSISAPSGSTQNTRKVLRGRTS